MNQKITLSLEITLDQLEELFNFFDCDFLSYARDCDIENCRCRNCTTKNNCWEWRGPCKENGGSDA